MISVKRILILFIFQEEKRYLWVEQSLAIQRITKAIFGRRIKGLRVYPETLEVRNDWIAIKATADKVHDDRDVDLEIEMKFNFEETKITINLHFPDTGEIRQKQISFENMPI